MSHGIDPGYDPGSNLWYIVLELHSFAYCSDDFRRISVAPALLFTYISFLNLNTILVISVFFEMQDIIFPSTFDKNYII